MFDGELKLVDLGISIQMDHTNAVYSNTISGTELCMAPEMYGSEPFFTAKSDVWGLGLILFYLCNLELPFRSVADILQKVHIGPNIYSIELQNLIFSCLQKDARNRPSL